MKPPHRQFDTIAWDLIGPITPPCSKGNSCTNVHVSSHKFSNSYTILQDISTEKVIQAYQQPILAIFGGSILFHWFSVQNYQQSSDILEKCHSLLNTCICKHIHRKLDWEDTIQLLLFSFRVLSGIHSKKSLFILLFGRDCLTPDEKLLSPETRWKWSPWPQSPEIGSYIGKEKYLH